MSAGIVAHRTAGRWVAWLIEAAALDNPRGPGTVVMARTNDAHIPRVHTELDEAGRPLWIDVWKIDRSTGRRCGNTWRLPAIQPTWETVRIYRGAWWN